MLVIRFGREKRVGNEYEICKVRNKGFVVIGVQVLQGDVSGELNCSEMLEYVVFGREFDFGFWFV